MRPLQHISLSHSYSQQIHKLSARTSTYSMFWSHLVDQVRRLFRVGFVRMCAKFVRLTCSVLNMVRPISCHYSPSRVSVCVNARWLTCTHRGSLPWRVWRSPAAGFLPPSDASRTLCVSVCACWCACVGGFLCDAYFQPSLYKEGDNQKTASDREDGTVGQVARQLRNSWGVQRGMPTIDKSQPLSVQVPRRQAKLNCWLAAPSCPSPLFCLFPPSVKGGFKCSTASCRSMLARS